MAQIKQINILDMIKIYGEEDCRSILSSFICPLNKDVENFIHNKSIEFALQHIAITFLVFVENRKQLLFVGYYTLANKFVSISGNTLSKTMQKRISKFSQYDTNSRSYLISMPLIAQLGKNFAYENVNINFTGTELLTLACNRVLQVQKIIGGKMTYIECSANQKLYKFYSEHDFVVFGKREKENEELSDSPHLVQMLKYFKN